MNSPKTGPVDAKDEEEVKDVPKISEFPEFAEICCFMQHFGDKLGVSLTFPRISRLLSCETDVDMQSLTTLLVKLLNKMHHRSQLNRWQPALGRFLQRQAYNYDELREIGDALNNGGPPTLFFSLPPEKRLRVLLFCLETQFQLNSPFKEKVKSIDTPNLKTPPLGVDIFGNSYWLLTDNECHFLLYRSEAIEMKLELLADTFSALESTLVGLKDEKYEKSPVSELYAPLRGVVSKAEPPSPPRINPPLSPDKAKVETVAVSSVKEEISEQPFLEKSAETEQEDSEQNADKWDPSHGERKKLEKMTSVSIVTSEETKFSDTYQKQEQTKENVQDESSGLRRSSRKRKPVAFLKIENFSSPRYRVKKSTEPAEKKNKKQKEKGKNPKKKKVFKGKSLKKKGRTKKKSRNGHNGTGNCLWTRSPGDSEESENDDEEDLWEEAAKALGENSDSSLPENEKQLPHDWLEDIESDFDENVEGDDCVITGRNLQRRQNAEILDEAPCQICTISNHPEWLLLCDSCDLGYHAQCLRPALHYIPSGDWFCPRCLHARLVTTLSEELESLKLKSKKFDSAARMQERLNFVNISVSNLLRDERTRQLNDSSSDSSDSDDEEEEEEENGTRVPSSKRQRCYRSNISNSSSVSDSEEESESESDDDEEEEEEEDIPVRSTRHKNIHYDVNAAFQELDEVLVEDEKYALEKMERSKARCIHTVEERENEEEEDGPLGRPPLPPLIARRVKKRTLSTSSSQSGTSGSEGGGRRKRKRRPSSGSEEFRPSNESVSDEEDSELPEEDSIVNSLESMSSDQSWRVSTKRRRRGKRSSLRRGGKRGKRLFKHRRNGGRGRSGRRIPRFEGPSSDEDEIPLRRSARARINYREFDSSEEEEEEMEVKKKRRSSESEYAPSQEEAQEEKSLSCGEDDEEYAEEKEVEESEEQFGKNDEIENQKPLPPSSSAALVQPIEIPVVQDIPQGITEVFPIPAELDLDESDLQIDEELIKGDDTIFQDLLMGDINLSPSQETPGAEGRDNLEGTPRL